MLSDKDKNGLQSAIDKIADYCGEGLSPNDAIVKAAQDMKLTKDTLPILVNAFNVGATAEHWASGSSVKEKTASFPIADIHEIRRRLYPNKVKTASASRYTNNDPIRTLSARQLYGDGALNCYRPTLPAMQKAASVPTAEELHQSAQSVREAASRAEKDYTSRYNQAMFKLEDSFSKLASIVKSASTPSFSVLKQAAETVYGRTGTLVMDELLRRVPSISRQKLTKVSSALRADSPFYQVLSEVVRQIPECHKVSQQKTHVLSKCAQVRNRLDEQWMTSVYGSEMTRSIRSAGLKKQALREDLDVPREFTRLEAMLYPDWEGTTEREYGILQSLSDDAHEARLRNIMAESILIDLMNTDEALRTYDPESVLEAYNELMEVAPHLAGKKLAIRQALREFMATESLDLNALGQLAKLEADTAAEIRQRHRDAADQAARFAQEQRRQAEQRENIRLKEETLRASREDRAQDRRMSASEAEKSRKAQAELAAADRAARAAIADADRKMQEQIADKRLDAAGKVKAPTVNNNITMPEVKPNIKVHPAKTVVPVNVNVNSNRGWRVGPNRKKKPDSQKGGGPGTN